MAEMIYYGVISCIVGSSVGSFIACWIYRHHRGISIVKVSGSHCDNCNKKLNILELTPVLGMFYTKGKCRKCGVSYSKASFYTETILGIATPSAYIFYAVYDVVMLPTMMLVLILSYLVYGLNNLNRIEVA